MTDESIKLDIRRGMAAQKATDISRLVAEVEANERSLRQRQDELELQLAAAPALTGGCRREGALSALDLCHHAGRAGSTPAAADRESSRGLHPALGQERVSKLRVIVRRRKLPRQVCSTPLSGNPDQQFRSISMNGQSAGVAAGRFCARSRTPGPQQVFLAGRAVGGRG